MELDDTNAYLPLKRRYFKHWIWTDPEAFCKRAAWLDLMQMARFDPAPGKQVINGQLVVYQRGQIPASQRYLAQRWKWSKTKVSNFINRLKEEGMIEAQDAGGTTIITLLNYDKHNKSQQKSQQKDHVKPRQLDFSHESETSKKTSTETKRRPGEGQGETKYNKVNKEKKENNVGAEAPHQPTPEEIIFKKFQEWIQKYTPDVAKMKEPFTIDQYAKIKKKLNRETVEKLLFAMHNRVDLFKRKSAYLTILNWSKNEFNQINGHNGHPTEQGAKIAAAIREIEGTPKL